MDPTWNRREFVQLPSMLAALGIPAHSIMSAANPTSSPGSLAGAVSSVTLIDDAVRLSGVAPEVADSVSGPLNRRRDFARLGALLPGADQAVALIEGFKASAAAGEATPAEEAKFAFGAGWVLHHALEKRVASLVRQIPAADAVECRVYHDVAVLRDLTLAKPAPYSATNSGVRLSAASGDEIESFFQLIGTRRLIALHTFKPDGDDVDGWIRRLYSWRGAVDQLFKQYAAAYREPEPAKWKRYVEAPGFYAANHPMIRLCRSFQKGGIAPRTEIVSAVESREPRSIYSEALGHSYRALRGISSYFEGKSGNDELRSRLEISG